VGSGDRFRNYCYKPTALAAETEIGTRCGPQ
jgi:hypothetical protein